MSIDTVALLIQNVGAVVKLESKLARLVKMIDDMLSSLDLNLVIVTLAYDVEKVVNRTLNRLYIF